MEEKLPSGIKPVLKNDLSGKKRKKKKKKKNTFGVMTGLNKLPHPKSDPSEKLFEK